MIESIIEWSIRNRAPTFARIDSIIEASIIACGITAACSSTGMPTC